MATTVLGRSVGERYTTQIVTAHHAIVSDEPAPAGDDLGPTPYELLLAALGSCTSMTLLMYARRKGWPLHEVQMELTHDRVHAQDCEDCEDDGSAPRIERIRRQIVLVGPLTAEQQARLHEIAERCPVQRTLNAPPRVEDVFLSEESA
jgi:putative redox protein